MRLLRLAPLAAILIALMPAPAFGQRFAVAGIDNDSSVLTFLHSLQVAVATDDSTAVARLVHFPLTVNDSGHSFAVRSPSAFLRQYRRIINPNVRRAITQQNPDSLFANWQGLMIGRGQVWFSLNCRCTYIGIDAVNRDAPSDP